MRGGHCIRHWSSTQTTLALSSGEAELGGLSHGMSHGIGLRSLAADLGIVLQLKLCTDAPAAMGMTRRLGVGTVRHPGTALLWLQGHVRSGDIKLEKALGVGNPADALTNYLPAPALRGRLSRINMNFEEGRPASGPQLTTLLQEALARDKEVLVAEREQNIHAWGQSALGVASGF